MTDPTAPRRAETDAEREERAVARPPLTMVGDDAAGCVDGMCEWPAGGVEGSASES